MHRAPQGFWDNKDMSFVLRRLWNPCRNRCVHNWARAVRCVQCGDLGKAGESPGQPSAWLRSGGNPLHRSLKVKGTGNSLPGPLLSPGGFQFTQLVRWSWLFKAARMRKVTCSQLMCLSKNFCDFSDCSRGCVSSWTRVIFKNVVTQTHGYNPNTASFVRIVPFEF